MSDLVRLLTPWEPSVLVQVVCWTAVILYLRGWWRQRRSGVPVHPASAMGFLVGMAGMYAVTQTYYDYLSQFLFFAHRAQHLVLHHLAPFLIALSAPATVLAAGLPSPVRQWLTLDTPFHRACGVVYRALQQPVIACVLFVGLIYFWLHPAVHFDAMLNRNLYWLMNWSMALDGLLFWWLVFERGSRGPTPRLSYRTRFLMLVVIVPPQIFIGARLGLAKTEIFDVYDVCGRAWPISPITDQQIGGLITWIPASMMSVVAALVLLRFLLRAQPGAPSQIGRPPSEAVRS